MIDDDTSALREALAAGPTPGPWTVGVLGHGEQEVARVNTLEVVPPRGVELAEACIDASFLAAASPDRIARLLDEIERLRAEGEALRTDAERYAFAKTLEGQVVTMETFKKRGAAELDAAIDAAKGGNDE